MEAILMENLDFDGDSDDLLTFLNAHASGYFQKDTAVSRFLGFGDAFDYDMRDDLDNLKCYAENKFAAIVARRQGLIQSALELEKQAEGFYNQLSQSVRW